jgi:aminopeptidase N
MLAGALLGGCLSPDDETAEPDETEAAATFQAPSPGAPGIGDTLLPTLGNGGYDVLHYDLRLRYETADPAQSIDGTATILAKATQSLSRFNLDFGGDSIGSVTVNGQAAAWQRDGEELVITPAHSLHRGALFAVQVNDFVTTPAVPDPNDFLGAPFFIAPDGSAWAGQPDGAHRIFPSNDHPADKASFTFLVDVPAGTTAVASGVKLLQLNLFGRARSLHVHAQPMATELVQVAVGDQTVIARGVHGGVIFRDVVPSRLAADLGPKLALELAHMEWLVPQLGDYPFDSYGSLAVDTELGFALETQTLSLYEARFFGFPAQFYEPIMVHELAHQWFGNSVAPTQWADVWQNEGHATWYELTYQFAPDSPELAAQIEELYSFYDLLRFFYGPVGSPLSGNPIDIFNPNVYYGGAVTLYALRQQVGDATFREIEREWLDRYRGMSASTADFIDLASEVSGQDLHDFLAAWLYGDTTPPMPGHPEWVVIPVQPLTAMARAPQLAAAMPPSFGASHAANLVRR